MVFLFYIGTEGSGANNAGQRNTFAISQGVAQIYRERVTAAILALSDTYLYWPDADERRKIAYEINVLYNFPHCVATADGTLFHLPSRPETMDVQAHRTTVEGSTVTHFLLSLFAITSVESVTSLPVTPEVHMTIVFLGNHSSAVTQIRFSI